MGWQLVAVGGDDRLVHVYAVAGDGLKAGAVLSRHANGVTRVAFSPCGRSLATADSTKEVVRSAVRVQS